MPSHLPPSSRRTAPSDAREAAEEHGHGSHTLRVWRGMIVGHAGDDVFVELGPRMQGVISLRAFEERPEEGECFEFTLRGREESLWALALAEDRNLATWESMEAGSLVSARVLRVFQDGLQLKVGPLHAFLPRSQTGLSRGHKPEELVGRTLTVEVIEVAEDKQRIVVSRKLVAKRERQARGRNTQLLPGNIVHGQVTRIEDYGVFVKLPGGREGLLHVSNMSFDRDQRPDDVTSVGDSMEVKVLHVRAGGKRIALGLKQLQQNPWKDFAREHPEGEVVPGIVRRFANFGAFVEVAPGVVGLVHNSQSPWDKSLRTVLHRGQELSVRVLDLDVPGERLALSLCHENGRAIALEEAAGRMDLAALANEVGADPPGTSLGRLLAKALARPKGQPQAG